MPTLAIAAGKTSIRQVCDFLGRARVAFIVDLRSRNIYVKRKLRKDVARLLAVRPQGELTWHIVLYGRRARLQVKPFTELNQYRTFTGHVAGISKSKCVRVPEGRCVNVVDENGSVSFSFKAPKEFYACSDGEEICLESEQTNILTIYDQPNCKGSSRKSSETLLFCQPA